MKKTINPNRPNISWLATKLKKHKEKQIKRDLKKNNYKKSYPATDSLKEIHGTFLFCLTGRTNTLGPATLYHSNEGYTFREVDQVTPLKVEIALINDTEIVARSDGFIQNEVFYHPDIFLTNKEKYETKNQAINAFTSKKEKKVLQVPKSLKKSTQLAGLTISLIKEHSFNYYHFLFECLPKLLLIQSQIDERKIKLKSGRPVTILIDEHVPHQCLDYIHSAVSFPYQISRLAANETVHCEQLLYCSPFFNALDNVRVKEFCISDFYVDKYAVSLVKQLSQSMVTSTSSPHKLLYLGRTQNQKRNIINLEELSNTLNKYEFETVFPDRLSTYEQIALFQSALCIVGASGAAFTNIIHMQPGTTAIMLSPNLPFANYHLFQQQADASDVNLIHIQTDNRYDVKTLHDDTYLDVTLLEALLRDKLPIKGVENDNT